MKINPINNTSLTFGAKKTPEVLERYYAKKSKSFDKKLQYSYDMLNLNKSTPNAFDILEHSTKVIWNWYKIFACKILSLYYSGKKEM